MASALKKEEDSEDLPGQGSTRSAVNGIVAELEISLINKVRNCWTAIIQETPIQPFVNGLQVSRVVKSTVKKATTPEMKGGRIGMQGADKTWKFPPGETFGQISGGVLRDPSTLPGRCAGALRGDPLRARCLAKVSVSKNPPYGGCAPGESSYT